MGEFKRIMPQKDGIYALKLSNLGYVVPGVDRLVKEDSNTDNLITGEEIGDVYTLVTYKGNGLFEEHYSGEKAIMSVRIFDSESSTTGLFADFSDDNIFAFNDEQQKISKLKYFKNEPLTVDPGDLIQITPEIISIINTSNLGDSVRSYINEIKNYSSKEIEDFETSEKQVPKTM